MMLIFILNVIIKYIKIFNYYNLMSNQLDLINKLLNCSRCGYNTDKLSNLKRHLTNKTICNTVYSNISREEILNNLDLYIKTIKTEKIIKNNIKEKNKQKKIMCEYCNKSFSSRFSKSRHKKNCKEKDIKNRILELDNIIKIQMENLSYKLYNISSDINNISQKEIIITNLANFNSKAVNLNLKSIFSVGTYQIGKFIENKGQYFIDCIKDYFNCNTPSFIAYMGKIMLQSENPLTKNMFMDNEDDSHVYIHKKEKFYKIKLLHLIKAYCFHITEIIKKILSYKDEFNDINVNRLDFIKFELDRYKKLSFFKKKKEIFEILRNQLIINRTLIEDFLQKPLSVDDIDKLRQNDNFTFTVYDDILGKSKKIKNKPIRKIIINDSDYNEDEEQSNIQTSNQVNSTNVYSDI